MEPDSKKMDGSSPSARESIIESFGIRGLYGYRSISLSSNYAATILIARNGTGKTTLLGALDAFLRMQFSRLNDLEFSEIHCKLRGVADEIVMTREDLAEFMRIPSEGDLIRYAARINTTPPALFHFVVDEWDSANRNRSTYHESKVYSSLLQVHNYSFKEVSTVVTRIRAALFTRTEALSRIYNSLQEGLLDVEILYLPTYRRIELALREDPQEPVHRRKRPKFDVAAGSLFSADIQFGLADISERLSELNQRMIIESNNGYREISANIINELIDGSFENENQQSKELPTKDELVLFFSRLEEGRRVAHYPPVTAPNLDKIYSAEGVPELSGRFLTYFLSKLASVINATKDVEIPVDGFIGKCNKYLLSREPSTILDDPCDDDPETGSGIDAKVLRLNRKNLSVHVESAVTKRKISLDALSSGEKQMISLFAKLFLYPGPKIVLIDEPELSLSIDWQRQILVDVLSAPLCRQVIAITHSPFVFDNELEAFASSLKLSIDATVGPLDSEGDIDE